MGDVVDYFGVFLLGFAAVWLICIAILLTLWVWMKSREDHDDTPEDDGNYHWEEWDAG